MSSIDIKELRRLIKKSANRPGIKEGKKALAKKLTNITKANVYKLRNIKWISE